MDVLDKVFGGKSVVLGGDFRQTLPVKKGGSKAEIIAASIAESHLWNHFKVYTLTENTRLQRPDMNDDQRRLTRSFATWLLDVGNGKIGTPELMRYFSFGRHLDDLHVTWAHLERKDGDVYNTKLILEDLCSQSLETASQAIHDVVTTHQVTASHISRCHLTGVASCDVHVSLSFLRKSVTMTRSTVKRLTEPLDEPEREFQRLRRAALRSHQNDSLAIAGRNLFDNEAPSSTIQTFSQTLQGPAELLTPHPLVSKIQSPFQPNKPKESLTHATSG
ncbi:DNA helicase [Tanacetum coccineum]